MCYIYPNILVDVFLTGREKLSANAEKPKLDHNQQETRYALAHIWGEQLWHEIRKERVREYPQELFDAHIDGASKGMKTSSQPNDVTKDINSRVVLQARATWWKSPTLPRMLPPKILSPDKKKSHQCYVLPRRQRLKRERFNKIWGWHGDPRSRPHPTYWPNA